MTIFSRIHGLLIAGALFMTALSAVSLPLSARDVSLDPIYIKRSPILAKITSAKLELYDRAGAALIDTGVAFAGWRSGSAIISVKDTGQSAVVYETLISTRVSRRIGSVPGSPLFASVTQRYLLIKSARINGADVVPYFSVLNLSTGAVRSERTQQLFLDYSVTPFGVSYLKQGSAGIVEKFPDDGREKVLVPRSVYAGKISPDESVIPYLSPDGGRVAIVAGGAGAYRALVIERGAIVRELDGFSSSSEFVFIDSSHAIYRSGGPGNFRLTIRSLLDGSMTSAGDRTLNTNLAWSPASGSVGFLQDGCVAFITPRSGSIELYPLEGEDIAFSPDGKSIITLYTGRLFMLHREMMKKKFLDMKRAAGTLLTLYRDARQNKALWENEYSPEYLDRKIALYSRFAK